MKTLKFCAALRSAICNGEKTATWRLCDDKDLTVGDVVSCVVMETGETFAHIRLTYVYEKALGDLSDADHIGHERYTSAEDMYRTFSQYYHIDVNERTRVKIVQFELQE